MTKAKNKLLKVIYYDENAAIDYITIKNGGNITSEEINQAIEGSNTDVEGKTGANAKASLLKMLNLSLGVKSKLSGHNSNEKIIKSTITTNIMTEFIKIADKDDNIAKLTGLKLDIDKDTLTYLKTVYPYIKLLNNPEEIKELEAININKIDEVILSTKGYFEFIAYKDSKIFAILRFNVDCLKNNYKFNDLSKMDLYYYGIKVGITTKESIKLENEIKQIQEILTEDDLNKNSDSQKELSIYDIILAGVKNDETRKNNNL